ncbi:hypothetical protein PR242_03340, partial [Metamycoplasma hyosynoviae]|uniref:hypothetical protein n=1 Tax=Metamycoplasma hyosynoviae TaxID=29559 RepID=UPI002359EEC9
IIATKKLVEKISIIFAISSLVDNSLPNWEIIQRLKEYTENVEDLSYYEECRKKLLNFYFKYLRRLNEIF